MVLYLLYSGEYMSILVDSWLVGEKVYLEDAPGAPAPLPTLFVITGR